MPRGRPSKSQIRQNIVEILNVIGPCYGYRICQIYLEVFSHCTKEVIYHHLREGSKTGEFIVSKVAQEEGNYSWGQTAERIYYALGPNARPKNDGMVRKVIENVASGVIRKMKT
ncbi:MAG: hypothetical protein QXK37_06635 [Candidatus Woesearchaeota archaeon]